MIFCGGGRGTGSFWEFDKEFGGTRGGFYGEDLLMTGEGGIVWLGSLNPGGGGGKGLFGSILNPGGGGGSLLKSILFWEFARPDALCWGIEPLLVETMLGGGIIFLIWFGIFPTGGGGTKLGGNLNPAGGVIPGGGLNYAGFGGGVSNWFGPGERTIYFLSSSPFSILVVDISSVFGRGSVF